MLKSLQPLLRRVPRGLFAAALLALTALLPAAQAGDMPYGQGLLWRVERDGGPASYVLGTIHATDARLRRLPPEIDRAIDASRVMAFELIEGPEGAAKLNQAMLLPPGRPLRSDGHTSELQSL